MAFIDGYIWGLGMVIFIGPVFFTLLQSAFQFGFRSGFAVALGIFISDVLIVGLCSLGAGTIAFFENPENQFWIAIAGAIILFGLGLKYMLKPDLNIDTEIKLKTTAYISFFVKGFLVNFVNPFVFVVWISLIGYKSDTYGTTTNLLWLFLAGALLGILTTDTLKAYFAPWIKQFLSPKTLKLTYQIIGLALVGFGIRFIVEAIRLA